MPSSTTRPPPPPLAISAASNDLSPGTNGAGRQNGTEFDGLGLDWGRQAFNLAILEAFEKLLQQGPEEPASSSSRAQHQSRYQQASAAREGHGPSACAGKSIGSHCNDSGGVVAAVERGVAGGGASCLDGWRLRSRADVPWLFMSRRCCPVKGAAGPEKLPQEPGSRGASSIRGGAGPLFRSRPPAIPMPESIPTPGRPASSTPSACDRYLACRKKRPGASKGGDPAPQPPATANLTPAAIVDGTSDAQIHDGHVHYRALALDFGGTFRAWNRKPGTVSEQLLKLADSSGLMCFLAESQTGYGSSQLPEKGWEYPVGEVGVRVGANWGGDG
ncbi:hypothetical protein B0J15DRAFT_459099 [Fusarium solani]|uniref:Uncharacterized protein n=1 Tax=Fusarium solani TaxID=169388 RepID=A0A9P9RDG6_FUSSL|nr:uncharacterized protein B0J15DRAFT_459099 [Fusarium solani]KAH7274030.1 hypothetical protein B0J15DRAFT_459099 [Fusarium solani]